MKNRDQDVPVEEQKDFYEDYEEFLKSNNSPQKIITTLQTFKPADPYAFDVV